MPSDTLLYRKQIALRQEWPNNEDGFSLLSEHHLQGLEATFSMAESSMALFTQPLINE